MVPEAELDVRMDRQLALDSAHQSERENMPAPEEILRELDLDLFFDGNHLNYGHGFVQNLPKSDLRAGSPSLPGAGLSQAPAGGTGVPDG